MTPVKKLAKGHNFDSSNILNIEAYFALFSHNMKEKGIKGRVLFTSGWSCYTDYLDSTTPKREQPNKKKIFFWLQLIKKSIFLYKL